MITHAQARTMAKCLWGNDRCESVRTNRRGSFYFKCNFNRGLIVDNQALTDQEVRSLMAWTKPASASETLNALTDEVVGFEHPFTTRPRAYKSQNFPVRSRIVKIWTFENPWAWCLPVIFAGIGLKGYKPQDPLTIFENVYKPSRHQMLEAIAAYNRNKPALDALMPETA